MNKMIFVVYDAKAGYYKPPFVFRSKGEALRGFTDIANDDKSEIGVHPEDYCLYLIGEYDPVTANIKVYEKKESLGFAIEYKKKEDIKVESFNNRIKGIEEVKK